MTVEPKTIAVTARPSGAGQYVFSVTEEWPAWTSFDAEFLAAVAHRKAGGCFYFTDSGHLMIEAANGAARYRFMGVDPAGRLLFALSAGKYEQVQTGAE